MPVEITDVALVSDRGVWHPRLASEPPAGQPAVELIPGLTVEQLPADEADLLMRACLPRGVNFEPARQFGHHYAFVRRETQAAESEFQPWTWDPGSMIQDAIQLSRYIVLNAHCAEYAARRLDQPGGRLQVVPVMDEGRWFAWQASTEDDRDWLTEEDVHALGRLLRSYLTVRRPARVARAMERCEISFRSPYVEVASAEVVSAFESLLKTERADASRQFEFRVPLLARNLGFVGVTRQEAKRFYGTRSRSVHGAPTGVADLTPSTRRLRLMQQVLMAALRRSVEDAAFRTAFRSKHEVARAFPVPKRSR